MKNENKRIVIAEGEVTGHAHAIYDVEKVGKWLDNQLEIKEDVEIKHEEHDTQILEKGEYTVGIVKQFSPLKQIIESIRD